METGTCYITKKEMDLEELVVEQDIRPQLVALIRKDYPEFGPGDRISREELDKYRRKHLENIIHREHRELNSLEQQVLKSMEENQLLSDNIELEISTRTTFGQRLADKIAEFGGSWTFIIIFFTFLLCWMGVNVWILATRPFDPFPFILLNLILSCLAAIQAPIIMMSQNRQEQKDRTRSENDYKINLKSELEIRLLHEKIDHLIIHQNRRLLEIQELQMDYLEELTRSGRSANEPPPKT